MKNILPKDNSALKSVCLGRESYYVASDEYLQYEIEWALSRVFDQEAKNFSINESLKRSLNNSYDFSLRTAFELLDEDSIGFVEFYGYFNYYNTYINLSFHYIKIPIILIL